MAKGQKRSNKEVKKPKQVKAPAVAPSAFPKGSSGTDAVAKKKG